MLLTWQPFDRQEWLGSFFAALATGGGRRCRQRIPRARSRSATRGECTPCLAAAGFDDVRFEGWREPMYFGRDVDDPLRFVAGQHVGIVNSLSSEARARALGELRATLGEHLGGRGVFYESAAWLIQARRP